MLISFHKRWCNYCEFFKGFHSHVTMSREGIDSLFESSMFIPIHQGASLFIHLLKHDHPDQEHGCNVIIILELLLCEEERRRIHHCCCCCCCRCCWLSCDVIVVSTKTSMIVVKKKEIERHECAGFCFMHLTNTVRWARTANKVVFLNSCAGWSTHCLPTLRLSVHFCKFFSPWIKCEKSGFCFWMR